MEMAFRVTEGLVGEFAAREQVPLLDELIMAALLFRDRSLMQSLRPTPIVSEVLQRQCFYLLLQIAIARQRLTFF